MQSDRTEQDSKPAFMHKEIKEIIDCKGCSSSGCVKPKDGEVITEKEKVLERWVEYIRELFHDKRSEKPDIHRNMEGPKILRPEIRAALAKMKRNNAAGPDEIVAEMLTAMEEFGVQKLADLINKNYESGEIPDDLSKSVFVALPEKSGVIVCELHHTISLMSHITKLVLRIIMARTRSRIRPEVERHF